MFIQKIIETLTAYQERVLPYLKEQGDYTELHVTEDKLRLTFNNDYVMVIWLDNDKEEPELHIECGGESIFSYAKEHGWSYNDIAYMKYGRTMAYDNEFDEEYEEEYRPSATEGDYSPSSPWNAPGMSVSDFVKGCVTHF